MGVTNNNDIYSSPHPHQNLSKMSKVVSSTLHHVKIVALSPVGRLRAVFPNPAPPAAATARHKKRHMAISREPSVVS